MPGHHGLAPSDGRVGGRLDVGGVLLRGGLRGLVAAEVDVGAGGELGHRLDDGLQEASRVARVCPVLHAVEADADVEAGVGRLRLVVAVQVRHRGQRGLGVAGAVDLGHHGHEAGRGVGDDLLVVRGGVVPVGAAGEAALRAGAHLGQVREGVDGDAPSLVVGQVQMQSVDLVGGGLVDVALDLGEGEEAARDVQHHAAVLVSWRVGDLHGRDGPRAGLLGGGLDRGGEQLAQGLHTAEQALGPIGLDNDAVLAGLEGVSLGSQPLGTVGVQDDGVLRRPGVPDDREVVARRRSEQLGEVGADAHRRRILGEDGDAGLGGEGESRTPHRLLRDRLRHQGVGGGGGCGGSGGGRGERRREREGDGDCGECDEVAASSVQPAHG